MSIRRTPQPQRDYAPWADPSAVPLVRFENVTKRFGDFVAVDDLSLDIYRREFFALLGPSGCGKTTLLRMLAGFETPSQGRILLDGEDVSRLPPYRRPVNMMFQSYALFPHMTVAANIAFGLRQDGMPKPEIKARVDEMLELVQLAPFAHRKPHQLSGGQRQRVALARSLAKKPKLLLLDEPLGALDKKLREKTQFELMDLQYELGLTFVIVTHDQEEAMTVSDRIGVMNQGKLIQVAPPGEIYEFPATRYVADFIGDVTLIEARVTAAAEGETQLARVGAEADEVPLVCRPGNGGAAAGGAVAVAIRPEKVRISKHRPEGADVNTVTGQVWDIGYFGDFSIYHVRLADGTTVKAQEPNLSRLTAREITWEDTVWLSWAPEAGVVLRG